MKRFEEKTAIITGGGGDLGRAAALRLLAEGANLLLADYAEAPLLETLTAVMQAGYADTRVKTVTGDVRKFADCQKFTQAARQAYGRVDMLVAAAGILKHAPVDQMAEEDWQSILDVNLTGVFHTVKAVVPIMKEQQYGRIVLVSSIGGRTGRPGVGVNYAASKAGVVGMTMSLAYELGAWNITVNSIAPGPLKGKMHYSQAPETAQKLRSGIPLERLGELEEAAAGIAFLASDDAAWATGEVLDYNGGLQF